MESDFETAWLVPRDSECASLEKHPRDTFPPSSTIANETEAFTPMLTFVPVECESDSVYCVPSVTPSVYEVPAATV